MDIIDAIILFIIFMLIIVSVDMIREILMDEEDDDE